MVKTDGNAIVNHKNFYQWRYAMKTAFKWGTVLVLAGLTLVTCKVVNNDEGSANTINSAKFENGEISGWNEITPKGLIPFTASDMVVQVNGGAQEYINKGLSLGFQQEMVNGEQSYRSWIMDFGTEANAQNMYNSKVDYFTSDKEVAGSYPETKAFVRPSQTGYDGYAIFGRYMVSIWLDGFGANKSEGKNKTLEFLQTIEQKIKELGLLSKS